jgi:hypothetical protein
MQITRINIMQPATRNPVIGQDAQYNDYVINARVVDILSMRRRNKMATVYKIELELTSHWVAYTDEGIKETISGLVDEWKTVEHKNGNDLQIRDLNVVKKA